MVPLLMTVGSILLMWTLSSQGLNNSAVAQKDASVAAESDAFATSVSAVLNVESSCSKIIQYGDNGIPLTFDIMQNPVVTFSYGLYYPVSATLLSSAQGFISTGTYSNTVTIPNVAATPSTLRIDPTGFINYGIQTSGPFASPTPLNCYEVNLHVEPKYPNSVTGNQTGAVDFPIQIGVVPSTHVIQQCVGGSTYCTMANPTLIPSPLPSNGCQQLNSNMIFSWNATNTSYVQITGGNLATPVTVSSNGPAYITAPGYNGTFVYQAIPYNGYGAAAPSPYPSWVVNIPANPDFVTDTVQGTSTGAQAAWITENTASVSIAPTPAPAALQPASGYVPFPSPTPSTTFTFTANGVCGATTTATAVYDGLVTTSCSPNCVACGFGVTGCSDGCGGTCACNPYPTCNGQWSGGNCICTSNCDPGGSGNCYDGCGGYTATPNCI
jgi:hypothetical protein